MSHEPTIRRDAIAVVARELGAVVVDEPGYPLIVRPDVCRGCDQTPLLCVCPQSPETNPRPIGENP